MINSSPIPSPPPGLVEQWREKWSAVCGPFRVYLATQAAQWGADQELEACCEWLDRNNQWAKVDIDELRDARRPKPPSLKEQALLQLDTLNADPAMHDTGCYLFQMRRALEALPND